MPDIIKFDEEFKNQCNHHHCLHQRRRQSQHLAGKALRKKTWKSLINTGDQYQRYRQIVHFQTTPKLFILDAKKRSCSKTYLLKNSAM